MLQPTQELIDSGLPTEVHSSLGYRSVTAEECKKLMGYSWSGWVVPMCNLNGKPYQHDGKDFYRLKPAPGQLKGDKPPKYLTAKDAGCRPYYSPLLPEKVKAKGCRLFVTEGEKKADCLNHHGFPCIGLSGVDAWRDQRSGESAPLPELLEIDWRGREVFVAYDSDVTAKESVRNALARFCLWLISEGAKPFVVLIPCELDGEKNGCDDFIARHGVKAFAQLVRIARPCGRQSAKAPLCEQFSWTPEPKEPHHKALTAWTVFDGAYANRPNHGLYRWTGKNWKLNHGKDDFN